MKFDSSTPAAGMPSGGTQRPTHKARGVRAVKKEVFQEIGALVLE